MHENRSPWLHQLNLTREINTLKSDIETDIVVVGAGIAGVSTAFFLLQNTDKKVTLVESDRVAHGASGHNGGQAVSYFERELHELVGVFGLQKATEGQRAIEEDSWKLLDEMYTNANLDIPMSRFTGYTGIVDYHHVLEALENNRYRVEGGINPERLLISDKAEYLSKIDDKYSGLYEIVPEEELLGFLETNNKAFTAAFSSQKGCFNSALLCNEMITFFYKKYPERFELYERTPVQKIIFKPDYVLIDATTNTITCKKVVLCTNGFETVTLIGEGGLEMNRKFHAEIQGYVGYMSAYFEEMNKPPTAIGYIESNEKELSHDDLQYYYVTRRPYEFNKGQKFNMISVGGPGHFIDHHKLYDRYKPYPQEKIDEIDAFLKRNYEYDEDEQNIEYKFTWHGLMGYTKNRVRLIGFDPADDKLLYNLGCNGVGLMPSIYGGWKVAEMIKGVKFPPAMFDPYI